MYTRLTAKCLPRSPSKLLFANERALAPAATMLDRVTFVLGMWPEFDAQCPIHKLFVIMAPVFATKGTGAKVEPSK